MNIRLPHIEFYRQITILFFRLMIESVFVSMIKYLTAPNKVTRNSPRFSEEEKYPAKLPLFLESPIGEQAKEFDRFL